MRKFLTSVVLLSVVFLFALPSAWAQEEDIVTQIDAYINRMVDEDIFSGSVLIAKDGAVILSKGYGLADREWGISNATDTKFRILALSMQFTAMGILLLQEQGLLSVNDPICQHLSDCPESWQDITIHQLLNHSSGIPNYLELPDFDSTLTVKIRPDRLIEKFRNEPLIFEPGTEFRWSNSGYVLLGAIIDEVSGTSYGRFLRDNFFEPLGMSNTGIDGASAVVEHRAEGYANARQNADFVDMSVFYASASLYSTVEDLYIWHRALYGGEVVPLDVLDAMWENAYSLGDLSGFGDDMMYDYGLVSMVVEEHRVIFGWTSAIGFSSISSYYPDDDLVIIFLSNREDYSPPTFTGIVAKMFFEE